MFLNARLDRPNQFESLAENLACGRASTVSVSGVHSSVLLRIPDSKRTSREVGKVPEEDVSMLLLAAGPTYSPQSSSRYARRSFRLTGWISVDLEISSAQGHATSGQAKHGSAAIGKIPRHFLADAAGSASDQNSFGHGDMPQLVSLRASALVFTVN
jgi:hypothetical protein